MKYKIKIKNVHFIEIDIKRISSEDFTVIYRLIKEHYNAFFEEDVNHKIIIAYEAFFYFLSIEDYQKCDFIKESIKGITVKIAFNRIHEKYRGNNK